MAATTKQQSPTSILRTSTFTFLQHLHFFIATPSFLAVPYSASVLLSRSLLQTSLLEFQVQPSSSFNKIITLKLTVPFSLTFLLFAKSSVFTFLKHKAFSESESVISSSIFWPFGHCHGLKYSVRSCCFPFTYHPPSSFSSL
ncbi:hypothetical protein LINGRAHAP2_LOCUS18429 [Linum grandiflorum]